jgi:hypothetical protein
VRHTRYAYAGPSRIRDEAVTPGRRGVPITSPQDVRHWLESQGADDRNEPFTYVVDVRETLLLAPRRSEHVACAGGEPVLAAGEITFHDGTTVEAVTNQSTGYRPDPSCWPAVASALDRAGLRHPGRFTSVFHFRECEACGDLNIVKDGFFVCALCDAELPADPPPVSS